jgi:hypothetical protein
MRVDGQIGANEEQKRDSENNQKTSIKNWKIYKSLDIKKDWLVADETFESRPLLELGVLLYFSLLPWRRARGPMHPEWISRFGGKMEHEKMDQKINQK